MNKVGTFLVRQVLVSCIGSNRRSMLTISTESYIQPLQPWQECIPPSLRSPPNSTKTASKVRYSQERWLQKVLPEAGPARSTIASMTKTHSPASLTQHPATLMAIGKASDIDQTSGRRNIQVMAMAHGEAGNLLRLIKPRAEALKWNTKDDTKLRSLNPAASEDCYWLGDGGAIQQIAFGADTDGSTSWLAVLKAESITILRPLYRQVQTPSMLSVDSGMRFPPSRLSPNPILSLGNESIGGSCYVDVSFNPWYIRQFAVIDQHGYWSVWDIEGQRRKRTTFEAKPGRSGHIRDDLSSGQGFKTPDVADGWGQVLWAGGVSTLMLCDRRNLAVFDLKAAPKRLNSPQVVHPRSIDWILDMKRSPVNLKHVFVLTTRQIFWLQISEAGEDQGDQFGYAGATILLSCQHFRNQEDETAKLDLLGENEGIIVFLA
jgi:RNA polymerase I-specific transcription initiation factor RRN6